VLKNAIDWVYRWFLRPDLVSAVTVAQLRRHLAARFYSHSLVRFRLGRILLHVLAMLGDRSVRFHAAGIMRELPWMAH
jgi:hypothetical protein